MASTTTNGTGVVRTYTFLRVPKRRNRLAALYWRYLAEVCEASHHAGACILLNSWHRGGRFGRLWHRFVKAVMDAAADGKWTQETPQ